MPRPRQTNPAPAARRAAIRFILVFVALLFGFEAVYHLGVLSRDSNNAFNRANAAGAAGVLWAVGRAPSRHGTVLSVDGGPPIQVRWGCDGLEPIGVLLAGLLAFPFTWRRRLIAASVAVPLLAVLNVLRLAVLALASAHAPGWFSLLHLEVLPGVLILAAIVLWLAFIAGDVRRRAPGEAARAHA